MNIYVITEEFEVVRGDATAYAFVDANSEEEAIEKYENNEYYEYEIIYDTENKRLSVEAQIREEEL